MSLQTMSILAIALRTQLLETSLSHGRTLLNNRVRPGRRDPREGGRSCLVMDAHIQYGWALFRVR